MKREINILFLLAFFTFLSCKEEINPDQLPNQFTARVVRVKDGDSMEILYKQNTLEIRLHHIDCPEKNQPFSNNAKQFSSKMVLRKKVSILPNGGIDRFDRIVAEVITKDSINLNKALVENGLAMHFTRYSNDLSYADLELQAKKNKVGMWSLPNPTPPWEYRENERQKEKALY